MRLVVQRVQKASVAVKSKIVSFIGSGLLIFVGVGQADGDEDVAYLVKKVSQLRIFEDVKRRMNLSLVQVRGAVLSVPQFTLYATLKKGNRPGFDEAAAPSLAKDLWVKFNQGLRHVGVEVQDGVFGAHMEIALVNDGPVTIWLDSK